MTRKELNEARKLVKKIGPTAGDKLDTALSAMEMAMSCLIYNEAYLFYDEKTQQVGRYGNDYIEWGLTKQDIQIIYDEQKAEFEKGILHEKVGTDSEGVVYNGFTYRDE